MECKTAWSSVAMGPGNSCGVECKTAKSSVTETGNSSAPSFKTALMDLAVEVGDFSTAFGRVQVWSQFHIGDPSLKQMPHTCAYLQGLRVQTPSL